VVLVVVVVDGESARTTIVLIIQGWIVRWYLYVPGTVSVTRKEEPGSRFSSVNGCVPLGTLRDITVWVTVMLFVHVIVLLMPVTTVMLFG